MDTLLWVAQVLLALAFLGAGILKLTQPYEKISERMAWAKDFSPGTIRLIGLVELLGAIGVIVPSVTMVLPWVSPVAAAGLVITMLGAMATHVRRGEYTHLISNVVLLALAAFVVYGRFAVVPLVA